jgi:LmbE family N-acetylglucosaminyl deacetylase
VGKNMRERLALLSQLEDAVPDGFVEITNFEALSAERRGLTVEGHPDDLALSEGIVEELIDAGVNLTNISLTDGGARELTNWSSADLVEARKGESINSLKESGVALAVHVGLPDRRLLQHARKGIEVVKAVVAITDPEFILVTNEGDEHPDHASAALITLMATKDIPIYMMDTVTTRDINNNPIIFTHAFEISAQAAKRRDSAFLEHVTQTDRLAGDDQINFDEAFLLHRSRGLQFEKQHAAVLFHATPERGDPVGEILREKVVFRSQDTRRMNGR